MADLERASGAPNVMGLLIICEKELCFLAIILQSLRSKGTSNCCYPVRCHANNTLRSGSNFGTTFIYRNLACYAS